MMLDKEHDFSAEQDIGQVVGTYPATNGFDLGAAGAPKQGGALYQNPAGMGVRFRIREAVTTGSAATVQFRIIRSAVQALTSPAVITATEAIAHTDLVADYIRDLVIPAHKSVLRWLGVDYVVAGATTTAGTVDAFLYPADQLPNDWGMFN